MEETARVRPALVCVITSVGTATDCGTFWAQGSGFVAAASDHVQRW